jgi:hypothetical protein
MSHETALKRALHELAEAPGPDSLANAALAGAERARRKQVALGGLAAVAAAAMIAAPFLLRPSAQPSLQPAAPRVELPANATDECVQAPSVSPTVKRVAPENWPDFVQIVMAKLPPRADYEMQSGYALCKPEVGGEKQLGNTPFPLKAAYAVINLGPMREHGHLTVNLAQFSLDDVPQNCAAVQAELNVPNEVNPTGPKPELLFCDEATATTPLVFASRSYSTTYVNAVFGDFRVWIESIPFAGDGQPEIGPEALRAVVTDPALPALNR